MFFCQLYNEVSFKSEQTIMSDKCIQKEFIYNVLCFSGSWCLAFLKEPLPKETSLNSVNYLNKFLFIGNQSCPLDYDIDVNTLFKAVKNGFTVKVKNIHIQVSCQVQKAVDVKRIVTRLALFQFSEGQSGSSKRES